MATYCSILAWEIAGTKESGRLQSMGSQRVGATEQLIIAQHVYSMHIYFVEK